MSKSGGKGRVSNELVAASCAAVLTVYAAGYWRTRDVARQMEARAQERRPMKPSPAPVAAAAEVPPAPEPVETVPAQPPIAEPEPGVTAPPPTQSAEAEPVEKPAPKVAKAKKAPAVAQEPEPAKPPTILSVPLVESTEPTLAKALAAGAKATPSGQWHDGTYTGWGTSYHGDIEAKVVIEGGRIVDSGVATCGTRYPCDVIYTILFQPVERQNPDVDRVSRATESADAYYYGLLEALTKALEAPAAPAAAAQ